MGRRPDYNGGGSIEYMKKGKHYDCRHRCEDGDCMNRASKWFDFMCREVRGKCDDFFTFNDDTATASKMKPSKPLGSNAERCAGSSPVIRTIQKVRLFGLF